jgi:integrase/recombinase XerD
LRPGHWPPRNNALLMFLYNTRARASEAAFVAIQDIQAHPDGTGSVKLTGKGAKTRHCPLWPTTLTKLQALTENRALSDRLFINQRGQSLTRFGILAIVRRHVGTASSKLEQTHRPTYHTAHYGNPFAACRRGH